MLHFILTWLGAAIALVITAYFVPGFKVDSFTAALIGAAIMGFVNAVVRPILIFSRFRSRSSRWACFCWW